MKPLDGEKTRILQTKEYGLFKYEVTHKFYKKRLDILTNELSQLNLSKDLPIIVDVEYNILDGIYRFEANKALGAPIYYKVAEVSTKLALMKAGAITYKPTDYEFLLFHKDKLAYRKVLEWEKILPWGYREIVQFMNYDWLVKQNRKAYGDFKDGLMIYEKEHEFKFKKIDEFINLFIGKYGYHQMEIGTVDSILVSGHYSPAAAVEFLEQLPLFEEFIAIEAQGHPFINNFETFYKEAQDCFVEGAGNVFEKISFFNSRRGRDDERDRFEYLSDISNFIKHNPLLAKQSQKTAQPPVTI